MTSLSKPTGVGWDEKTDKSILKLQAQTGFCSHSPQRSKLWLQHCLALPASLPELVRHLPAPASLPLRHWSNPPVISFTCAPIKPDSYQSVLQMHQSNWTVISQFYRGTNQTRQLSVLVQMHQSNWTVISFIDALTKPVICFVELCTDQTGQCELLVSFTDAPIKLDSYQSVLQRHQSNQTVISFSTDAPIKLDSSQSVSYICIDQSRQLYICIDQSRQLSVSFVDAEMKPDSYQFYRCIKADSYQYQSVVIKAMA